MSVILLLLFKSVFSIRHNVFFLYTDATNSVAFNWLSANAWDLNNPKTLLFCRSLNDLGLHDPSDNLPYQCLTKQHNAGLVKIESIYR